MLLCKEDIENVTNEELQLVSRDNLLSLIREAYNILGKNYLIIAIEELAELIEVVMSMKDEDNNIHLAEELTDAVISIDIIEVVTGIKISNDSRMSMNKADSIATLSRLQQALSKYLRYGDTKHIISNLDDAVTAIMSIKYIYDIHNSTINKIRYLKYDRLKSRIESGELH